MLFFVDDFDIPLSQSSVLHTVIYFKNKILKDQLSVHKLRHTHATLLLEAGVPMKVIQDRLGHQSMQMTEKIYSHVTPAMKEGGMAAFNQYIKNVF
nr:tyrosine-type recombinase/integrase [Macrococcus carouselicus]